MRTFYYTIFAVVGLSLFGFSASAYGDSGQMSILDQTVNYDIENGQVVDIYLDVDFVELILDFVAVDDGLIELTIPRGLLDAKLSETTDDIFFILVDGFETEYIEIESSSGTRTLVIPFFGGDEQIEIIGTSALEPSEIVPEIEIPSWVKNNAGWWSEGDIPDSDFVSGIKYMITNGIMTIPETESGESTSSDIPSWVKNNAGWWSEGKIPDSDFVSGIQYLITNGIIGI